MALMHRGVHAVALLSLAGCLDWAPPAGPTISGIDGTGPAQPVGLRTEDETAWSAHAESRRPAEHRIDTGVDFAYGEQPANQMGRSDHRLPSRSAPEDRMAGKEEETVMPFAACPVCGGELAEKEAEKILRGGSHTAVLKVRAEVCLRCGERLYSEETVRRFEEIRSRLERQDTAGYTAIGVSYEVG
jgi:YgiT-type zinc finger domain-containing protein